MSDATVVGVRDVAHSDRWYLCGNPSYHIAWTNQILWSKPPVSSFHYSCDALFEQYEDLHID